jgi:hypothetical protein
LLPSANSQVPSDLLSPLRPMSRLESKRRIIPKTKLNGCGNLKHYLSLPY